MTSSIVGTCPDTAPGEDLRPRRPVLRPLTEVLPDLVAPAPPDSQASAPVPTAPPPPDPQAQAMAERVLRCAVEIVGEHRPVHQLTGVLRPALLNYLAGLRGAVGHLRPRVHSVHVQQPTPGVLEAAAVVGLRTGVRALHARFERSPTTPSARWCCTVLHIALTHGDLTNHR
ncbi:MAG: Rv3235 family protein [Actinomycetota bacterium]|nr:Rv3235 family protein [Actinomycetota bacterium]